MAKLVKLKDIAERAGVSIATVSMVLSGRGKISSEVSDRVLAISDQLEYRRPGSTADRRLAFRYVTILHSESYRYSWNFSYDLITRLESLLIEKGYYPLVIHLNEKWQVSTIIDEIRANRSGAIFSIDYSSETIIPELEDLGIPVIVINNACFQDKHSSVLADDVQGAYEGTRHLIEAGHRSIVFAEYEREDMPALVRERNFGFRQAMEEAGLPLPQELRIRCPLEDQAALERRIAEVFGQRQRPTAIFAHDDAYAACMISGLRKIGLGVPWDVSVIAPGDVLDYSQPFLPRISTMRIDIELMARMAVEIMMTSILRKERDPLVIKTKLHYMDRKSIRTIGTGR
ncbi:MAG: LacI family DNA-binding transcriptional regulator [Treponema sp.]|nr:LacI family DNA-binding transcriptional regulator [Treponema sp.]